MSKFHINDEGNPGKCTAMTGGCRFGNSETEHYATEKEARNAYEEKMKNSEPEYKYYDDDNYEDGSTQAKVSAIAQDLVTKKAMDSNYSYMSEFDIKTAGAHDFDGIMEMDPEFAEQIGLPEGTDSKIFLNVRAKRNRVWTAFGVEVNGERRYASHIKVWVDNNKTLKQHLDNQSREAVEGEMEDWNDLVPESKTEADECDDAKDFVFNRY